MMAPSIKITRGGGGGGGTSIDSIHLFPTEAKRSMRYFRRGRTVNT